MEELQQQINILRRQVEVLSSEFYKNNFSGSQIFIKACSFTNRLKVPHYSSAPAVGDVGDIIEVSGKLYICTTAGTVISPAIFTLAGSQT